ncbi:MAG: lamin tail domain-containing protein, partial [Planctomycetota bacterium]
MVASLGGIIFYEFYGDNTGGTELDVDGDGTATQEDEFVSVQNTSGAAIDISGWQIWSDSAGAGAPDRPQDGLYHTFPPGTELASGETLRIVNEITGTPKAGMQEASEGGVESGSGGTSTNFLSEGGNSRHAESVGLVDPSTGDYIILNLNGSKASGVPG